MRVIASLVMVLMLSGFVSAAASCTVNSFRESCGCVAANGTDCWESGKSSGITCMGLAYPIATGKYWMGQCKPLQNCVDGLQACQNANCVGSDAEKCASSSCQSCHSGADTCAMKAASCSGCGDGTCDEAVGETKDSCCLDCGCPNEDQTCEKLDFFGNAHCRDPADVDEICPFPFFLLPLMSLFVVFRENRR